MTDDRDREIEDREISGWLETLEPPEHRSAFWDDLRIDLAASTDGSWGTDVHPAEAGAGRRTSWRVLSVAAGVLLAVAAGIVLREEDREAGITTDTTPSPATEDTEPETPQTLVPAAPLRPTGDPGARGTGRVVGIDPTGSFVYVAGPSPQGGTGCEGMPAQALFVEPIGGGAVDGSERLLAGPPEVVGSTGAVRLRFGPDGEVAVAPHCEGAGAPIVVGRITDDGTFVDLETLTVPDHETGDPVTRIVDIEFRSAGVLVLTATTSTDPDGTGEWREHHRLYELRVADGEVTDLGADDVTQVAVADGGRLATLSATGTVRFDGEEIGEVGDGFDLHVTDDGDAVVAHTSTGGVALHTATGRVVPLDVEAVVSDIQVVPGDRSVIVSETVGDAGSRLVQVDLSTGGRLATLFEGEGFVQELALSPDVSLLLFGLTRPETTSEGAVVGGDTTEILEQGLTR